MAGNQGNYSGFTSLIEQRQNDVYEAQAKLDTAREQYERGEQMQLVEQAIQDTSDLIKKEHSIDWSQMLNLIHLTGMEKSMKNQNQDASNISARINLHSLYSQNTKGWFPWIFEQLELKPGMKVLELGCGDGTLRVSNTIIKKGSCVSAYPKENGNWNKHICWRWSRSVNETKSR